MIPVTHPVTLWMVEHASELLTKYLVGRDGKTPYERLTGKRYRVEAFEFGEKVRYQRKKAPVSTADGGRVDVSRPSPQRAQEDGQPRP